MVKKLMIKPKDSSQQDDGTARDLPPPPPPSQGQAQPSYRPSPSQQWRQTQSAQPGFQQQTSQPQQDVPPPPPPDDTPAMPGVSTAKRFNAKSINDVAQALPRIDFDQVERGFKRILMKNNMVRPGFSYSWVQLVPPDEARPVTTYTVKDTKIGIYIVPSETMSLYHAIPPEYEMSLDYMKLVYLAKSELVKHNPKGLRMQRAEEVRNYIARLSDSIIYQMARKNRISLGETRTEEVETLSKLSDILVRHTAGFGVSEIFLDDKHIQDVFINAPASENLVNVTIGDVGDKRVNSRCRTNILLGEKDAESLLARFRYESGRPFSEASPVLEHDVKSHGTRITAIGKPISPGGIGIAMRKASMEPWTLLKLMHHGSMNALTAGLISFLLDGKSTMIVAGSRGSGKTSMLGSIMLEFPQNQRILTIEDTLELPTEKMQTLGYEIQSMFVQSTLGGKGEMNAGDALRVSLRLGESAIVLGEVRGEEARTLFESMRAGTAGSAVLGTFHADSAKAVAERITGDMGILPQSFLATDIIIIAGLSRPGGALKPKRRITQIAEVVGMKGKDEIEFADLVNYNEMADDWKETDILKYKSKVVGTIAKDFGITSEQAMQNIMVRAAYRQKMVDYARANNVMQILSAEWVIKSNNAFWNLNEKDINEHGKPDYSRILAKWEEWFKRDVRYA